MEFADGIGDSWITNEITSSCNEAQEVFGIDLDGDDDIDVLSACQGDDTIMWYENADGVGGSWTRHTIAISVHDAMSVFAVDVDGDGDIDVLLASLGDDNIAWYENMDGIGLRWSAHMINNGAAGATGFWQ